MAGTPPIGPGRGLAWLLSLPLVGYRRWLSPLLPPACRFEPSCSQYALWALATHRPPRALLLVAWRLLRCQPLCAGGIDWPPPGPHGDAAALARTGSGAALEG